MCILTIRGRIARTAIFELLALVTVGIASSPAVAQVQEASWLDRKPLLNWNRAPLAIPKPPKTEYDDPRRPLCKSLLRHPSTPEDRALAALGWVIFGKQETLGGTTIVSAMIGVDGMCRPMGYQDFVFVKGRFAGTIAPSPMDSRSDGSAESEHLAASDRLTVAFKRYATSDALCCPSRITEVTFGIQRGSSGPVLVPMTANTRAQ